MPASTARLLAILCVLIFAVRPVSLPAQVLGRSGQGWLESIDGYPVLHVKGSHYEMGRQHGELLREHVQKNLRHLLEVKGEAALVELGPLRIKPRQAIETIIQVQEPFVPRKYFEEFRGMNSRHATRLGNRSRYRAVLDGHIEYLRGSGDCRVVALPTWRHRNPRAAGYRGIQNVRGQ